MFESGKWLVICDVCGFRKKSDEVLKRWDGLIVCKEDYETRHPQDFIRAIKEDTSVPFTRPEPTDTFVTVDVVASTVGVQETTIPTGHFTTNNQTL